MFHFFSDYRIKDSNIVFVRKKETPFRKEYRKFDVLYLSTVEVDPFDENFCDNP